MQEKKLIVWIIQKFIIDRISVVWYDFLLCFIDQSIGYQSENFLSGFTNTCVVKCFKNNLFYRIEIKKY